MPCVFPVLAIKALSVAQPGGEGRCVIRAQGLAYTAGVVVTILIIGGVLETLRAAGAQLGWGFQLRSPAFVTFTAWPHSGIGLNLAGAFEFRAGYVLEQRPGTGLPIGGSQRVVRKAASQRDDTRFAGYSAGRNQAFRGGMRRDLLHNRAAYNRFVVEEHDDVVARNHRIEAQGRA